MLCRTVSGSPCLLVLVFLSIAHASCSLPASNKGAVRHRRQYHNDWDQRLTRYCNEGDGIYLVESEHDNRREDRRWRLECRNVVQNSPQTYSWTSYVNNFDEPILFMCGRDEYLRGVDSYHNDYYEDRRWRFYCCHSPGYTTKSCEISDYVNSWDEPMSFQARIGTVITGAFSYHNDIRE